MSKLGVSTEEAGRKTVSPEREAGSAKYLVEVRVGSGGGGPEREEFSFSPQ